MPQRHTRLAHLATALAALLLLMPACQAQAPALTPAPAGPQTGPQAESALIARIRDAIGEARCERDAQCHTLAVGEKACGGPVQYLAWSGTAARGKKLEAWAAELAALQRQRAAAGGMMSNCQFMADPGAVCVRQRCVLRAAGTGGPLVN